MAHAVAALVKAAWASAVHEVFRVVFVAMLAVMVVLMLAAMAVFCVA
ncbi:hypothetical protein [Janthinobacterium svalbardensis]|nr:hypothetical protein [Janthinobacterium svalbardensis]